MKTLFFTCLLFTSLAATSLLQAAPSETVDLRPRMKGIALKDGSNLVYTGKGVKLFVHLSGGKVTKWSATDAGGKALDAEYSSRGAVCMVCIKTYPSPNVTETVCYEISCDEVAPGMRPTKSPK